MQPGDGSEIEEDQHFLLRLNGPAVEQTVVPILVRGRGRRRAAALRIVRRRQREQV